MIMMTRTARDRRFINGPLWYYLRVPLHFGIITPASDLDRDEE